MKKGLFIALAASFVLADTSYYHEGKKVTMTSTKETRTLDGKEVKFFRNSSTNQRVGVTPKVLFALKDGVSLSQIQEKFSIQAATSLSSLILAVDTDTPDGALELSSRLYESGLVKFAHPNFLNEKQKRAFTPTDPLYPKSWHLTNTPTISGAHINIDGAWAITKGKGVKVAVYDDAVLTEHEDLKPNVIEALDAKSDEKSCAPKTTKDTHGTFVAGIAVAATNSLGGLGVAPESSLVGMRGATGGATEEQHIVMFNHVKTSGVGVMNNSWGGYNVSEGMKTTIKDVIKNGRNGKGTVIIFAYGNDSCNDLADVQCKQGGSGADQGFLKNDESSIDEAFTVVALNQKNEKSSYSNWGTKADIAAPGGDGDEITQNKAGMVSTINKNITESAYASEDPDQVGTSYAAPVIAGVSALVMAANPELTSEQVMQIIKDTADKVGGYTYTNGRSNETGYGKVNAAKAVQKAYEMAGGTVSSSSSSSLAVNSSSSYLANSSSVASTSSSSVSPSSFKDSLQGKTFDVSGTFGQYDFTDGYSNGVATFDWAFTATGGMVFQLQGNAPSSSDVFGWRQVNVSSPTPAWYMFYTGFDIDGDGTSSFDWILVSPAAQAVFKLAGVEMDGTFKYSDAIPLGYTISQDKTKIIFNSNQSSSQNSSVAVCTTEYAPVCGSDGKTYSNSCVAKAAGIATYTSGECTTFSIKSSDIQDGAEMALKFANTSQGGENISPEISWSGLPSGTKSLALEMIDIDYQDSKHWVVLNIPTSISSLPQGVKVGYNGITFGTNSYSSFGDPVYTGPFPPAGEKHRYQFTLYALSANSVTTLEDAKKHILSSVKFTPVYTGK